MSRDGLAQPGTARRAVLLGIGAAGVSGVLPGIGGLATAEPEADQALSDRIARVVAADGVERATLYEEDPNNPNGTWLAGSALWSVEMVLMRLGQPNDVVAKAEIAVPERQMLLRWELRRNHDRSLPASHTIDFVFELPADFRNRGIRDVPGLLMKPSVDEGGAPLAGLSVKVASTYFLMGLSTVDTELERNLRLLKERPWFAVPIVYESGGRAILVFAKGETGARALSQAFAAWDSATSDQKSVTSDQRNDGVKPPYPFPPEIIEAPRNLPRR